MTDLSILPPAFECPDCGVECRATITFDPDMGERVDAWRCPECEAAFYREAGERGVVFHGLVDLKHKLRSAVRRGGSRDD